jgi:NADPH:quinone reductase-like Zn-dependent oxidoreductase
MNSDLPCTRHRSMTRAPMVLGGEGAGVVEDPGDSDFPAGSRVMFAGPYGATEDGTYGEWLAVRKEHLCLIPENIGDVSAAGLPVAYLTAQMTLDLAGFQSGKTVLSPAIGGSVGNAVTQLARARAAKHAISTTISHAKAKQAHALGFKEVVDLSVEKLGDGVRRITENESGGRGWNEIPDRGHCSSRHELLKFVRKAYVFSSWTVGNRAAVSSKVIIGARPADPRCPA